MKAASLQSLQPVCLSPPVGFSVNQCLWSRCCWTIVQPDINNNKPLARVFSPFRHSQAIIISQKHCIWACLAPGITACKHFSCLCHVRYKDLKPQVTHFTYFEHREKRGSFVKLVMSTVKLKLRVHCGYSDVPELKDTLYPLDPQKRKRCVSFCLIPSTGRSKVQFRNTGSGKDVCSSLLKGHSQYAAAHLFNTFAF